MAYRLTALLLLAALASPAQAGPRPLPFDIKPVKKHFTIYHDGHGHYLVVGDWFLKPQDKELKKKVRSCFYGNGKVFYRQYIQGYGGNSRTKDMSLSIPDPRVAWGGSSFSVKKGVPVMHCRKHKTQLVKLNPAETTRMLDKGKFFASYWQRAAHFIARDDSGLYYYVDRIRRRGASTYSVGGFRLFIGPRGKLKRLKLSNIVADPAGEIFVSRKGKLKLMNNRKEAIWIRGKTRAKLVTMNPKTTQVRLFIYRDLGVYFGQRLHRPCDDM